MLGVARRRQAIAIPPKRRPARATLAVSLLASFLLALSGSASGAGHGRPARLPKMLYPTPDYSTQRGGTIWHGWIRPRRWRDGDDVNVLHAHWLKWRAEGAEAIVRVSIAGRRGRGRVKLSDPGYCPAAHTYGFLEESDSGGPWGPGGSIDLSEYCESARATRRPDRRGAAALRLSPEGLGPIHFGMTSTAAEAAAGQRISVEDGVYGCSFWSLPGAGSGDQLIARNGRLFYAILFKRGTATTRGIKIGDGLRRLRHRYRGKLRDGRTASLGYAEQHLFVTEHQGGAIYELEFDIVRGRIAFISAATKHVIETFGECA
jgi:hypothetical protein